MAADIRERLTRLYERFPPHEWLWLVSYSGGKDSTALLLAALALAREQGFRLAVVYNDTGGDPPELRALALDVLRWAAGIGHEIFVTRPERTFFDYLLTRYSPPRWNFRWCCKRLKELPFRRLVEGLARRHKVLNLVGTRRDEARWRDWDVRAVNGRLVYAAPLRDATAGEVWRLVELLARELGAEWIHRRLAGLYAGGRVGRTGCWYCPLVVRDSIYETLRPELLRLKLEVLEAWCSGRRERILELAREHPDLVRVTVGEGEISRGYPCGRRCNACQVRKVRERLRELMGAVCC
jgi:3'-phosphoadenosine 5'-phosphosulfate sulfotransferase (PAPS reductase)/FAD synthetase